MQLRDMQCIDPGRGMKVSTMCLIHIFTHVTLPQTILSTEGLYWNKTVRLDTEK